MKNLVKKYWFISAIAVIFVAFIGLMIFANVKDKLAGKQENGKDVVAVFNDKTILADDVYKVAKDAHGSQTLVSLILKELFNQAVETTDEIKKDAETRKNDIVANYKKKYGDSYELEIGNALKRIGYTEGFKDLDSYLISQLKSEIMLEQYLLAHKDQYFKDLEEKKGRIVSHILVKFPTLTQVEKEGKTQEEIEKLQQEKITAAKEEIDTKKQTIDKELESKAFSEVASQYSEDETSKVQKGSLGFVNTETSFVKPFLDASLALEEGKVSEWVETTYGFHKIKVDAVGVEKIFENKDVKSQVINTILQQNNNIYKNMLKEIIEKYPVSGDDEIVKKAIDSLLK